LTYLSGIKKVVFVTLRVFSPIVHSRRFHDTFYGVEAEKNMTGDI